MPNDDKKILPESEDKLDAASLVREHIGWMLALAESILREHDQAEDVVQDAFMSAFSSMSGFEGRSSLKTWLHRITVNAALDRLRRTGRLAEQPIDDLLPEFDQYDCRIEPPWGSIISPQQVAESVDLQHLVRQQIDSLPDAYRIVLHLRDVEEYNTEEVAEMLDLTITNVKVRLHRARSALKKLLEPILRGEIGHDK